MTIGVVGLGAMGSRVARRLLDAGHDVAVWNRTPARAEALVDAGAVPAASPAEVARTADAVITMVADPDALQTVVEGPDGIAASGGTTTVIEMSTVGPAAVAWLASALPEATELLDAPVLGSIGEVEAGSLKIFVGGPAALVERWAPVLSTLGCPMHVGDLGAGAAAKLVANSTLLGSLALLGEAVAFADGLGLSRAAAFEILGVGPLAAQAERRRDALESGEYPPRFSLSLARKDADLIADAAAGAEVDLRLGAGARSWLADAERAGYSERDYAAVLDYIIDSR